MKNFILSILLVFSFSICFAQNQREVEIKPFMDTTSVEFHKIFGVWENYMDELNAQNRKANFLLKNMDKKLQSYWAHDEIENYLFPDLYYSFRSSYGNVFYPMGKEYFLGIAKRNINLYELKTMFIAPFKQINHNFPAIIITVPVIKTGDSYKLCNKFTLNKPKLSSKKLSNITYNYAPFYQFNDSLAQVLNKRIEVFKKNFQINKQIHITYLVADNITEISKWFGIDYFQFDYNGELNMIEGRAIKNNNIVLSAGGGENYLHEIIHILLKDFDRGNYPFFEEGIACFFGGHVGHDYAFHAKRLKEYLQKNDWIDLSENLEGYYKNDTTPHSYKKLSDTPYNSLTFYGDEQTNYVYIIHAVLCDMAFRQGGYAKVKEMFLQKADNQKAFYQVIENELGIKREDVNKYIRDFLKKNF